MAFYGVTCTNSSLPDTPNSASLARAQRDIQKLQDENKKLREDLSDISSLYHQLASENGQECYDERRVNFLKSQMIQLERQVVLLSEALSSRSACLLEVENALGSIADTCRNGVTANKNQSQILFSRSEVTKMVETAESARKKLYKNIEKNNVDNISRPLLFMDRFVKQNMDAPVTLMDICHADTKHINLKHVAKLESRLSQLFTQLRLVSQSFQSIVSADVKSSTAAQPSNLAQPSSSANPLLPDSVYLRLAGQVAKACNLLNEVTPELLELSVLVPSAPWPPLQKPYLQDLTLENVLCRLPKFPKSRATEGRQMVEALLKSMNYTVHMSGLEAEVLREEVSFHQSVYQLQQHYIQDLFNAVRSGYSSFEEETNAILCQPLSELLVLYEQLQQSASEEALKAFLNGFKENEPKITTAISQFRQQQGAGTDTLSAFGQEFFQSVSTAKEELESERNKLISNLDIVKQTHKQAVEEVEVMFSAKSDKNKADEYDSIINATKNMSLESSSQNENPVQLSQPDANERRRASESALLSSTASCSCGADSAGDKPTGKPSKKTVAVAAKVGSVPASPVRPPALSATKNPSPITRKLSFKKPTSASSDITSVHGSTADSPSRDANTRRTSQSGIRPPAVHVTPDSRSRTGLPMSVKRPTGRPRLVLKPNNQRNSESQVTEGTGAHAGSADTPDKL